MWESSYAVYIEATGEWIEGDGNRVSTIAKAKQLGGIAMLYSPVLCDNGISGYKWVPCVEGAQIC